MNKLTIAALSVALLALTACGSKGKKDSSDAGAEGSGTYGGSAAGSGTEAADANAAKVAAPSGRILYFDLDRAELKPEGQALADAWAAYLAANPSVKVRLEGHCDERGTREYNVSLGERRGNSVLAVFTAQGVGARQLSVSSFGEERPVDLGHDEAAWAKNRRVEIVP